MRVIERYAARWAIEVAIEDAKQLFGTGQARNCTAAAVERTIPFMLAYQAIAVCWYATAGHHPADTVARRLDAPWYTPKAEPSTADMTAKFRRVIVAARFKRVCADQPEPAESMPSAWLGKTPPPWPPRQRKSSRNGPGPPRCSRKAQQPPVPDSPLQDLTHDEAGLRAFQSCSECVLWTL